LGAAGCSSSAFVAVVVAASNLDRRSMADESCCDDDDDDNDENENEADLGTGTGLSGAIAVFPASDKVPVAAAVAAASRRRSFSAMRISLCRVFLLVFEDCCGG